MPIWARSGKAKPASTLSAVIMPSSGGRQPGRRQRLADQVAHQPGQAELCDKAQQRADGAAGQGQYQQLPDVAAQDRRLAGAHAFQQGDTVPVPMRIAACGHRHGHRRQQHRHHRRQVEKAARSLHRGTDLRVRVLDVPQALAVRESRLQQILEGIHFASRSPANSMR